MELVHNHLDENEMEQILLAGAERSLLDWRGRVQLVHVVVALLHSLAYLETQAKGAMECLVQHRDKMAPLVVEIAACLSWKQKMMSL